MQKSIDFCSYDQKTVLCLKQNLKKKKKHFFVFLKQNSKKKKEPICWFLFIYLLISGHLTEP